MSKNRSGCYAKIWYMIGMLSHTSRDETLSETLVQSREFKALDRKLRSFPFTDPEESG